MEVENAHCVALEKLNYAEIQKLCRACLEIAEPSFSLYKGSELSANMMWMCTGIQPFETDGLPSFLCARCLKDLTIASKFKTKAQHSNQLLHRYLNSLKFETEEFPIKVEVLNSSEDRSQLFESVPRKHKKKKKLKEDYGIDEIDHSVKDDIKSEFNDFDNCIDSEVNDIEADDGNMEEQSNGRVEEILDDNKEKNKNFICEICQRPLSTKYSLQHHMKTRHSGKKKQIGNISGWGAKRRFHCIECSYSTPHSQSLVYHMRIHTGEKPFKCDICNRCFSQPGSLSCHKKTHSDKTYFTCALCGKQFKYKETYESHKNVHIEEKKFTCSICNKGLKSKKTLEAHTNRHLNIKNYSCETCGAMFVTHVELLNHSRKHTAERKFMCNLCDFKTYVKKGLETHLRRHTGERPFKCDLCELSCYTKGELKCHRRKHTKEKNYSCPICDMRFIHSSSVNKHMAKSHNVKYNRLNIVDRRVVK